jgi:hypothetical protein
MLGVNVSVNKVLVVFSNLIKDARHVCCTMPIQRHSSTDTSMGRRSYSQNIR